MTALRIHLNHLLGRSGWGRQQVEHNSSPSQPDAIVGHMMSRWLDAEHPPIGLCFIADPVGSQWALRAQYYRMDVDHAYDTGLRAARQVWAEDVRHDLGRYDNPAKAMQTILDLEALELGRHEPVVSRRWAYDTLAEGPASTLYEVSRRLGIALTASAERPRL